MSDQTYNRTITPAPEVLGATATVGFVLEQIASDLGKHNDEDAEKHNDMWKGITAVSEKTVDQGKKIERLYGGLALLAVILVVFLPLTYYAVKGVIVEELDKRFPEMVAKRYHVQKEVSKSNGAPVSPEKPELLWSVLPSAQASSK